MIWYESARLIHGRQWPLKGRYYDNIFIHYRPRGEWYTDADMLRKGNVAPISLEQVVQSQKNMKETDWDLAWESFEQHMLNYNLKKDRFFNLGKDPFKEDIEKHEFRHLN